MNLSGLQRYILRTAYRQPRAKINRGVFSGYYAKKIAPRHAAEILGRSLDRLVERGMIIGYGRKTSEKWFIENIQLTAQGKKAARELFGHQTQLPLK